MRSRRIRELLELANSVTETAEARGEHWIESGSKNSTRSIWLAQDSDSDEKAVSLGPMHDMDNVGDWIATATQSALDLAVGIKQLIRENRMLREELRGTDSADWWKRTSEN